MNKPKILQLDPEHKVQLEKLARQYHKTVVIVTHTKEIARMGDRVVTMKDGRITDIYENTDPMPAERINW